MAEPSLGELWGRFLDRYSVRNERLIELGANCRREMADILEAQYRRVEIPKAADVAAFTLCAFQKARKDMARRLLDEPLGQWERAQKYNRVLATIDLYRLEVGFIAGQGQVITRPYLPLDVPQENDP